MKDYTETATAETLSLSDRIKALLDAHNKTTVECDAEFLLDHPDALPSPMYGIADVVKALSASDLRAQLGYEGLEVMSSIVGEIMTEIAGCEYNPWPELTKEELRFLIGDRRKTGVCDYGLIKAAWENLDEPLTFADRVRSDRKREWLEKGADAKRKRLAKAKADVALLTGEAA